jgi:hypothetical protein
MKDENVIFVHKWAISLDFAMTIRNLQISKGIKETGHHDINKVIPTRDYK